MPAERQGQLLKIDDARLRSCRRGTLAIDEAKKLAEKISSAAVREGVLEALSDLDSYDGDVVCHDGDLVVGEGFSTGFFFPEQHHFTVKGKVDVATLAGNHHRLESPTPAAFTKNEDLHGVVAEEYLVKDPEGRSWLFEKKSYREFLTALRRGEAVVATS